MEPVLARKLMVGKLCHTPGAHPCPPTAPPGPASASPQAALPGSGSTRGASPNHTCLAGTPPQQSVSPARLWP